MDRPHSRYAPTSASTTSSASSTSRTGWEPSTYERHRGGYSDAETAVIDDVQDYDEYDDEYDDVREYHDPIDRRWIWVAAVAGAILLIAVICTVVILGGGDSGSVSKTVIPPAPATSLATSTAPSVIAAPPPAPAASVPLSPETVTTVAPIPTAVAVPAPTVAAPSPRTVTYQVRGTRQMIDLVTVVYTDQQGALQTEFNVALPWSRTVALDPGVELSSVTATSLTGQLNCSITDAAGATLAAQTNNAMITTCTR